MKRNAILVLSWIAMIIFAIIYHNKTLLTLLPGVAIIALGFLTYETYKGNKNNKNE